jgi:hypothetical protein
MVIVEQSAMAEAMLNGKLIYVGEPQALLKQAKTSAKIY